MRSKGDQIINDSITEKNMKKQYYLYKPLRSNQYKIIMKLLKALEAEPSG